MLKRDDPAGIWCLRTSGTSAKFGHRLNFLIPAQTRKNEADRTSSRIEILVRSFTIKIPARNLSPDRECRY